MPTEKEKYLTVKEVAEILVMDTATIRRYCRKGLFPGIKRAGLTGKSAWRIPSSSVDAARQEMAVSKE